MKIRIVASVIILFCVSCTAPNNPLVSIETAYGPILLELFKDEAPVTVQNFETYVDSHRFDGGNFYRIVTCNNQEHNDVKIEVIQGGIGWDDNLPRFAPIIHESTKQTGILHKRGVISMARNEPGSASSEFFICVSDQPELDFGGKRNPDGQGFAAFGKVIQGMEVVDLIHQLPDTNQFLIEAVEIISVHKNP